MCLYCQCFTKTISEPVWRYGQLKICLTSIYRRITLTSYFGAMRKNLPTRNRNVHFGVVRRVAAGSTQPREPARAFRQFVSAIPWVQFEIQSLSLPHLKWPARASRSLNCHLSEGHECPDASAGYVEPSLAPLAAHIPYLTTAAPPAQPQKRVQRALALRSHWE